MIKFDEISIAKIRGGLSYNKLFSFSNRIKASLDENILPSIEKNFGLIEDIKESEGTIIISSKDDEITFNISDIGITFETRKMPTKDIGDFLQKIVELYDLVTKDLSLSNKINGYGVEFSYAIPLLEKKAIELINRFLFQESKSRFLLIEAQSTKRIAFQEIISIDSIDHDLALRSSNDNETIIIIIDNKRRLEKDKKKLDYKDLYEKAHIALTGKLRINLIEPFLSLDAKYIDEPYLIKGTR